ncbi:aldehyde dehydrogenase family protein [Bacteriovoracaceae bacterium]|nr:aldehyde dehydrogenase family protein [Bacteriovoracaceae bacterium]
MDTSFNATTADRIGQMKYSAVNFTHIKQTSIKAQREIAQLTFAERKLILKRIRTYIIENRDQLIAKVQRETLKSRTDALIGEIFAVCDHLVFLEKNLEKFLQDKKIPTPISLLGKKSRVYCDPLGTILIISPWNYPLYQAIVPITSALMTRNAVIYKPSEFTPLKGVVEEILEYAFEDQRKSEEWVQIVYGDGEIGIGLIDLKPNKIFFTGSVSTGKKIMSQAAEYLIPVELELGGKDAMVVMNDANIERASSAALWGALTNTGQSCTSTEKVYIHESVYDEFKSLILKKAASIDQGVDRDGNCEIGLITTKAQEKVILTHYEDALAKGAKELMPVDIDINNHMISPIILENVTKDMLTYHEESFGPFVILIPFQNEENLLEEINSSKYGLSGCVWSKNIERAIQFAHRWETGGVSINNVMLTEGNHSLPFGGVKESGIGRYKGEFGLYSFCNMKAILIDGNHNNIDPNWYPYTPEKYRLMDQMTEGLYSSGIFNFIKFAFNGLKVEGLSNKLGRFKKR